MNQSVTLHASCVAVEGRGALIFGASGSGKSSLALQLMAYGATLVADDKVIVRAGDTLVVSAPEPITGLIEARGVGLLKAETTQATLSCVIDLNTVEPERLPPHRSYTLLGHDVPLLNRVEGLHFAPAIHQFLKSGRLPT